MRLLHTSDWHLGTSFLGIAREPEHRAFFRWLVETIEREAVDVLLVAGDVFDHAHPSAESQRLLYDLLGRLAETRLRRTVLIGGNHDSAARLDAPRELLERFRVSVVGGLGREEALAGRGLVPIANPAGDVELVVLAVPYVHEYRLGVRLIGASSSEIAADLEARFAELYRVLADRAATEHPGATLVGMGHLACVGSTKDDAPVAVHLIGDLNGLPETIFDSRLAYVALGHVHRAYRVGQSTARYSGTPIAFSLSESSVPRCVRLVDLEGAQATSRALEVPVERRLLRLVGTEKELERQIAKLSWSEPLAPIVVVELRAERYEAAHEHTLRELATARGISVAELRTIRESATAVAAPTTSPRLSELSDEDVFRRYCADRGEAVDDALLGAFREAAALAGAER